MFLPMDIKSIKSEFGKNWKNLALATAILGATFGIFVGGLVSNGQLPIQKREPSLQPKATYFLFPEFAEVSVGEVLPIEIKLQVNEGLSLSGMTARLTYSFNGNVPLEPIGNSMRVNSLLSDSGWAFPVNSVRIDFENNMLVADIAAINLNPEGYATLGEITLATIELSANKKVDDLVLEFRSGETKLLTKSGDEVGLKLVSGTFNTY